MFVSGAFLSMSARRLRSPEPELVISGDVQGRICGYEFGCPNNATLRESERVHKITAYLLMYLILMGGGDHIILMAVDLPRLFFNDPLSTNKKNCMKDKTCVPGAPAGLRSTLRAPVASLPIMNLVSLQMLQLAVSNIKKDPRVYGPAGPW